jgi:hypothetical protein
LTPGVPERLSEAWVLSSHEYKIQALAPVSQRLCVIQGKKSQDPVRVTPARFNTAAGTPTMRQSA